MSQDPGYRRAGLFFGLGAYLFWGVLPLYFKLLAIVPPLELVANRLLWSLLFLGLLVPLRRRWAAIRAAASRGRIVLILLLTAPLIAPTCPASACAPPLAH